MYPTYYQLLIYTLLLAGTTNAVRAQTVAQLETTSGVTSTLSVTDYRLDRGQLVLTETDGVKKRYSASAYKRIDLAANLRFRSVANTEGVVAFYQQYLDGQLIVYGNGSNSVLVIDPAKDRPLEVSLSDNKRELTYLLQGCERLVGAERVEAIQTNDLTYNSLSFELLARFRITNGTVFNSVFKGAAPTTSLVKS